MEPTSMRMMQILLYKETQDSTAENEDEEQKDPARMTVLPGK